VIDLRHLNRLAIGRNTGHAQFGEVLQRLPISKSRVLLIVVSVHNVRASLKQCLVGDVLGIHMHRGDDAPGNEPVERASRSVVQDPAIRNQLDPGRATNIQVLANDLLEEHTTVDGLIQDQNEGEELRLQNGNVIAVRSVAVGDGERMRQVTQPPLARQSIILLGTQSFTDFLQPLGTGIGGHPVVQGLVGETGLTQLALQIFMPVNAQLGVVREGATELQEARTEVLINAMEVERIDHGRAVHDLRNALRITASLLRELLDPGNEASGHQLHHRR
jgi:hypothetical protein